MLRTSKRQVQGLHLFTVTSTTAKIDYHKRKPLRAEKSKQAKVGGVAEIRRAYAHIHDAGANRHAERKHTKLSKNTDLF
jgi:hypothetical protein